MLSVYRFLLFDTSVVFLFWCIVIHTQPVFRPTSVGALVQNCYDSFNAMVLTVEHSVFSIF
jgi:hypothetical protein